MALMQALLKIKADVQGSGAVDALGRSIGGLGSAAGKVSGGLKGLAGAAGGLGGALGALVPAASVAGLAAMAKGAIDTADNLAKMSAKTGVSVEQLSKFKQAADLGGTSIEGVSGAMLKLNKGLAAGTGPATEALRTLSISATDANGKLKSTDQIMLEVADKFKAMPDGAQKSALAMQLFGKAGAEMIPMLNGGSKAIDGLNATMSTKFAKAAEVFNDRITTIQGKLMELGVKVADVLMPVFNGLMSLIETIVSAISKLPGPIQAIILSVVALTAVLVILAPAISALISIAGILAGLKIGATIAGWAALAGPAIAAITAAFAGFMTFLTGTLIPGLLAVFTGPVGWTVLAVAAVVAMAIAFRKPLSDFANWLWEWGKPISQFWASLWNGLVTLVSTSLSAVSSIFRAWAAGVTMVWTPIVAVAKTSLGVIVGLVKAWQAQVQRVWVGISGFFNTNVIKPIQSGWKTLTEALPKAMESAAGMVKNAWRGVLQFIADRINVVGGLINRLIGAYNALPNFGDIPYVPTLTVPAFAKGGFVGGGTLAMVGEAGPEYIIPERKMAQASMNYLNGARGGAVIPAYAQGGYVGGSAQPLASSQSEFIGGNAQISITTGPIMQMNGEQYVTLGDLERAMRMTVDGVYASLRTPAGRYALGTR